MWNEKNLFTGCVDVPLTNKGVEEAIEAGKRISNIPVDMIFTSSLIRAQMTAMLAMTEHRRKKVRFLSCNIDLHFNMMRSLKKNLNSVVIRMLVKQSMRF